MKIATDGYAPTLPRCSGAGCHHAKCIEHKRVEQELDHAVDLLARLQQAAAVEHLALPWHDTCPLCEAWQAVDSFLAEYE